MSPRPLSLLNSPLQPNSGTVRPPDTSELPCHPDRHFPLLAHLPLLRHYSSLTHLLPTSRTANSARPHLPSTLKFTCRHHTDTHGLGTPEGQCSKHVFRPGFVESSVRTEGRKSGHAADCRGRHRDLGAWYSDCGLLLDSEEGGGTRGCCGRRCRGLWGEPCWQVGPLSCSPEGPALGHPTPTPVHLTDKHKQTS